MKIQKLILLVLLCLNAFVGAKPLSSIVLQNPDQCIATEDWDMLERDLGFQLGQVKFSYPKSSQLNLKVMVHGNMKPTHHDQIKYIDLEEYFSNFNDPSQGTLMYKVTGQHLGMISMNNFQTEFLCNINVDLPVGFDKKIIYGLNDGADFLTSAFAQSFNLLRLMTAYIAMDIFEICYVGYWADYFSEDIKTLEELKQHQGFIDLTLKSIQQQLLIEEPELKDNENLLKQRAKDVFDALMNNTKEKFTT